jgi:hypothetical protein
MQGNKGGHEYSSPTWYKHLVAEYTGLDFLQIKQLNYIEYLTYRRDAFIAMLNKSETGQEYLRNAWRMEQTEPDRAALRRKFGRKEALTGG